MQNDIFSFIYLIMDKSKEGPLICHYPYLLIHIWHLPIYSLIQ